MRVIADAPISEQLLATVLEAGSDPLVPVDAADTVDIIESGGSLIPISDCNLLDSLFGITAYRPPPTFSIRENELPSLAVRTLYWKAWLISLVWTSLNTDILIKKAYYKYPNLKVLMQIILTWFVFFLQKSCGGNIK
ncbi:unnamed protein product [Gongylonema pulchrum]|uniref:Bestrophin homolog n=1 Tax=Gongylonema pulchrum TaxID=637853 RepID=A0A183EA34_9BILA|nr:unnamed protein product [Gongylonema pulchrum]